jgi:hypothetical protein
MQFYQAKQKTSPAVRTGFCVLFINLKTILFSRDTCTVDTLYEIPLQDEIHQEQWQDAQHRARHADGLVDA